MRAKKSLGQHFLKSKSALAAMVSAAAVGQGDTVLEVGPGKGVLTRALLDTGAHVVAIETDDDLIPLLHDTFAAEIASNQLRLVHGDIRTVYYDIMHNIIIDNATYKVVANIPYYITGELIRMFLESAHQPTSLTLLVQKEVCDRIVARDGKESILSLSVKAYGAPRYIQKVPARDFSPAPKVDSAIVHIAHISKNFFDDMPEDEFFKVVKVGFSSKRKQLANNLQNVWDKQIVARALAQSGIHPSARAEDVPMAQWHALTKILAS